MLMLCLLSLSSFSLEGRRISIPFPQHKFQKGFEFSLEIWTLITNFLRNILSNSIIKSLVWQNFNLSVVIFGGPKYQFFVLFYVLLIISVLFFRESLVQFLFTKKIWWERDIFLVRLKKHHTPWTISATCNSDYNILELCNISPKFSFTINETERDY